MKKVVDLNKLEELVELTHNGVAGLTSWIKSLISEMEEYL